MTIMHNGTYSYALPIIPKCPKSPFSTNFWLCGHEHGGLVWVDWDKFGPCLMVLIFLCSTRVHVFKIKYDNLYYCEWILLRCLGLRKRKWKVLFVHWKKKICSLKGHKFLINHPEIWTLNYLISFLKSTLYNLNIWSSCQKEN